MTTRRPPQLGPPLCVTPVLHDIRSTYNVGAILRTAEGFGVQKVLFSGCTPRPHDPALLPHLCDRLTRQIHKTALGAEDHLELYSSHDILEDLKIYKAHGYHLLGLENNLNRPTIKLGSPEFHALQHIQLAHAPGALLLLGSEVAGIDYALYDIIDTFLEIPMRGQKESFNVSVAAGIALFALCSNYPQNVL